MIIRQYENGDLDGLVLREECDSMMSEWCWTICGDKGPLAVFSLVEFWKGTGHITGFVDDSVRGQGLAFTKAAIKLFKMSVAANPSYHRIQTYVFNSENARWAELMGMSLESTMAMAAPDKKDVLVYVWLR